MTRYLLAAEADKIQDFIFRATHLREVVGGSQILSRFGHRKVGAPPALGIPDEDLVVSGGGSVRAVFDSADAAVRFGEQLAEIYRQATDGSLTMIHEPVPFDNEEDFARASEEAQERLREAKRRRQGSLATAHIPYSAFCASCGVALATGRERRHEEDEERQYLCNACRTKGAERRTSASLDHFLFPFKKAVIGEGQNPRAYRLPGSKTNGADENRDPSRDLAEFDARDYVAYLVADGNSMGKVFDQCNKDQMRHLSDEMTERLRECLAAVTHTLKRQQSDVDIDFIPVLPLILGGDDLFALLPAPWALDFARHFCREFETRMTDLVQKQGIANAPERITVGAAVVICKESYPYYLAHSVGEELLKEAKRMAKRLTWSQGSKMFSTVNFEIILGSQAGAKAATGAYRATMRPYFVTDESIPEGWGLSLDALLEQRLELRTVSKKRLAQLRALFHPSALPREYKDEERWQRRQKALLQRVGRDEAARNAVEQALEALGGSGWYESRRTGYKEDWYGHGLPDLLNAWDFAYRIDEPRRRYEGV